MGGGEPAGVSVSDRLASAPAGREAAAGIEGDLTVVEEPEDVGPAVALVNGRAIPRQALVDTLIAGRGLALLERMLAREAARQEARRLGIAVNRSEMEAEYEVTIQAARFNGKDAAALTPARREQIIDEWSRSRNVTRQELDVVMEQRALLRKIVTAGEPVEISAEMLASEYDRVHGEKAEVRHLQLAAERDYVQVRQRLDRGERFEDIVLDYSQNLMSRERRGLLPPFSASDPTVPAMFAKAAFALKPGEVSNPIEAEGSFHVLKLERRIPADGATFEAVREELAANLRARIVAERMDALGERLVRQAEIKIEDPVLREQYRRAGSRMQNR